MTERTLTSYDPFAYYVTKHGDLDRELIAAYLKKDNAKLNDLLSSGKLNIDVYICINKHQHAFLLCSALGEEVTGLEDDSLDDPFRIPDHAFCWVVELQLDDPSQKTYKITKQFQEFRNIMHRIHRSFYIARYKRVPARALDLAAWRGAPTRYSVLLSDCVEFAKMFCEELQAYCSNYNDIKKSVRDRLDRATATGLSIEKLSRQNRMSGLFGNISFGGADATSFLGHKNGGLVLVLFVVIWPVIIAIVISKFMAPSCS